MQALKRIAIYLYASFGKATAVSSESLMLGIANLRSHVKGGQVPGWPRQRTFTLVG
jgi:hypothetical protein